MTIEAVHDPNRVVGGVILEIGRTVLGDVALGIGEADPGNHLSFHIGSDVFDFILWADMPMDAFHDPLLQIAAADFQGHTDSKRGVGFISQEVLIGAINIAAEFFGPMTLFTGFAGGPKIFDRGLDGTLVLAPDNADELVDAIDFSFDVGGGSGANVALHAMDARVR